MPWVSALSQHLVSISAWARPSIYACFHSLYAQLLTFVSVKVPVDARVRSGGSESERENKGGDNKDGF